MLYNNQNPAIILQRLGTSTSSLGAETSHAVDDPSEDPRINADDIVIFRRHEKRLILVRHCHLLAGSPRIRQRHQPVHRLPGLHGRDRPLSTHALSTRLSNQPAFLPDQWDSPPSGWWGGVRVIPENLAGDGCFT